MTITPIIGIEAHIELKTKTKMFCGCDASHFHADPNTHTCPVCLGLPGALPVPNKTACEWCIKLGLALGCRVNHSSFFERKNYFYPDLPKGYQISQYLRPFTVDGILDLDGHKIRINRVHLEEDTGKSVHLGGDTLLDFNRSGVPLVEIVSEPDINSPEEAKKYLLKVQQVVRYLGISDADIEKGSMRCEPTINIKIEDGDQTFYTPLVEIKNVASLTGVMTAIQFEIDRQIAQFQEDKIVKNSTNKTTRGWDAEKQQTFLQREKEGSADYRYFPEPDIPPIEFTANDVEAVKSTLPEMPDQKIKRYINDFGLSDYDSNLICESIDSSEAFEYGISVFSTEKENIKKFANLYINGLKEHLNKENKEIEKEKINPEQVFKVIKMASGNVVSSSVAKNLIVQSYEFGVDVENYAKENNLIQVSDTIVIEEMAKKVITDNPKAVADYRKKPLSVGFLVGQLMKASKGSANPTLAKEILEKLLSQ
ncbi:Asp-tRNA(Asn)/Glu-tRNA(Gln) amidotransferase subunit GatB [Candidatus Shapirobacteria bacterium]|nr:Asp-tRNA(Asn)/Glu-tRNA(Gln) amidotransferase subunit GatB [Candidatus Shapirobacteria bacterium]